MKQRWVPLPVIGMYLRELRASELTFAHGGWSTDPVLPKVGLRQGDFVSPKLFRWIPEDMYSDLKPKWEKLGYGVMIDGYRLTLMVWADDTVDCCSQRHGA